MKIDMNSKDKRKASLAAAKAALSLSTNKKSEIVQSDYTNLAFCYMAKGKKVISFSFACYDSKTILVSAMGEKIGEASNNGEVKKIVAKYLETK